MARGPLVEPAGRRPLVTGRRRKSGRARPEASGRASDLAAVHVLGDGVGSEQAPVNDPARRDPSPAIDGSQEMRLGSPGRHENVGSEGIDPGLAARKAASSNAWKWVSP